MQLHRFFEERSCAEFIETAQKVLKNVSKPMVELHDELEIHQCKLYYLPPLAADNDQKSQFVVFRGLNEAGNAYTLQSVFLDTEQTFEIEIEDFDHPSSHFDTAPI